jgi:hypothetical protein
MIIRIIIQFVKCILYQNLFDIDTRGAYSVPMSVELHFKKGSLATRALLKDEALAELQRIVSQYLADEDIAPTPPQIINAPATVTSITSPLNGDNMANAKAWLAMHSASEALNLIGWKTNAEKILILGGFHEAKGGEEGWRSADIETRFSEARESFPSNFPRDMSNAIKDTLIAAVTPRTYKISRMGWNKLGEAISSLGHV